MELSLEGFFVVVFLVDSVAELVGSFLVELFYKLLEV